MFSGGDFELARKAANEKVDYRIWKCLRSFSNRIRKVFE